MPQLLSKKTHFTVLKRKECKDKLLLPWGNTIGLVSEDDGPVKQHSESMCAHKQSLQLLILLS